MKIIIVSALLAGLGVFIYWNWFYEPFCPDGCFETTVEKGNYGGINVYTNFRYRGKNLGYKRNQELSPGRWPYSGLLEYYDCCAPANARNLDSILREHERWKTLVKDSLVRDFNYTQRQAVIRDSLRRLASRETDSAINAYRRGVKSGEWWGFNSDTVTWEDVSWTHGMSPDSVLLGPPLTAADCCPILDSISLWDAADTSVAYFRAGKSYKKGDTISIIRRMHDVYIAIAK